MGGALSSWVYAFPDDLGSALPSWGSLEGVTKTFGIPGTALGYSHGALGWTSVVWKTLWNYRFSDTCTDLGTGRRVSGDMDGWMGSYSLISSTHIPELSVFSPLPAPQD